MDERATAAQLNRRMVDRMVREGSLTDPAVEAAFRSVLRHRFLPQSVPLAKAYRDAVVTLRSADGSGVLPKGACESSSTMPSLLAQVLSAAQILPGMRILQIGTGPGYLVALLAALTTASGLVITLELDPQISAAARDRLAALGLQQVHAIHGDGYDGYEQAAPYDRVVITAACKDLAPAWHKQLREGGRVLLPLVLGESSVYPLLGLQKRGAELVGSVVANLTHVRFVPLQRPSGARPERSDRLRAAARQAVAGVLGRSTYPAATARAIALYADLELLASRAAIDRYVPAGGPTQIAQAITARWQADGAPRVQDCTFRVYFGAAPHSGWRWCYETPGQAVHVYLSRQDPPKS